jgi:hypothetical protein
MFDGKGFCVRWKRCNFDYISVKETVVKVQEFQQEVFKKSGVEQYILYRNFARTGL